MLKEKVIVIGAGVAGLTAAHELIERDFEVHVFERRDYLGGKAASTRDKNYPCEHGFRFFPSWYRHLPDTLGRIPYRGGASYREAKVVADNLIPVDRQLLTWYDREPVTVISHVPRSVEQLKTAFQFAQSVAQLGLTAEEMSFFGAKMVEFASQSDSQRATKFEKITWWDYLEADTKSQAFKDLVAASTRLTIAAKPEEASAYTIGRLVLRTLSDVITTDDRILNGPTQETWINPWVDHLRGRGVELSTGWELDSIAFFDASNAPVGQPVRSVFPDSSATVSSVTFTRVTVSNVDRIRRLLPVISAYFDDDYYYPASPTDAANSPKQKASEEKPLAEQVANGTLRGHYDEDEYQDALRSCSKLAYAIIHDEGWTEYRDKRVAEQADPAVLASDSFDEVNLVLVALDAAITRVEDASLKASNYEPRLPSYRFDIKGFKAAIASVITLVHGGTVDSFFGLESGESQDDANHPSWAVEFANHALSTMTASPFSTPRVVDGDYFVFALPVEQMAYYVNRSSAIKTHDPNLAKIVLLSPFTTWMSGIQSCLRQPCNLVEGHLVCMDTEWSLTAIEQTQFWRDVDLKVTLPKKGPDDKRDATLKSILSVDVATWDRPGRFVQLEAFNCTGPEIAREVWNELKASVTRLTKTARLRDDMLFEGPQLKAGVNYNIDATLADVFDRKKQAEFERARAIEVEVASETGRELPFIWGACRDFNAEPLLLNSPGTMALRPQAATAIPNMFIAGDYIRTETDLACMEGANESGRRAVNALLHAAGSLHEPCRLWPFSITQDVFERLARMQRGELAWGLAARAAGTLGRTADIVMGMAGQAVSGFRARTWK